MLSHRNLAPDDIPVICGFPRSPQELFFMFSKATWPFTPEQLKQSAEERHGSTVVLWEGEVAGYANFIRYRMGCECTLGNLIINPEMRRRGAATYLVGEMMKKAALEYQASRMSLTCFNTNTKALHFYHRLGFTLKDMSPRPDHQGDPVMALTLIKEFC